MLIYAGANVGAVTRIGQYTPLHLAAQAGNAAVVKALLKAGADVNAEVDPSGVTRAAPGRAVRQRRRRSTLLLDAKADVNATRSRMGTDAADLRGRRRTAPRRSSCCSSAAPTRTSPSKTIDLAQAGGARSRGASSGSRRCSRRTVGEGTEGRRPARCRRRSQAARELLLLGQDSAARAERRRPDTTDRNFNPEEINPPVSTKGGLTALLHAARQGYIEAAERCSTAAPTSTRRSAGDGTSPLLMAVINGQFDMAMLLIERGADPNLAAKNNGVTPLWAAVNTQWQPRTRFPQPQEMELQKAHLPRRDAGAARQGRGSERTASRRIPGTWSTPAAATATAVSPTPPARPRSGAPPTAPT